jgi:excisionase family DNA binding protein
MPKIRSSRNLIPDGGPLFYSVAELARNIGVSRRAVAKWIDAGKIEAIQIGQVWAIPKAEARRIIKQREAVEAA